MALNHAVNVPMGGGLKRPVGCKKKKALDRRKQRTDDTHSNASSSAKSELVDTLVSLGSEMVASVKEKNQLIDRKNAMLERKNAMLERMARRKANMDDQATCRENITLYQSMGFGDRPRAEMSKLWDLVAEADRAKEEEAKVEEAKDFERNQDGGGLKRPVGWSEMVASVKEKNRLIDRKNAMLERMARRKANMDDQATCRENITLYQSMGFGDRARAEMSKLWDLVAEADRAKEEEAKAEGERILNAIKRSMTMMRKQRILKLIKRLMRTRRMMSTT
ncbi:hypothetical protein IV203_001136 [Nitzschia inconspicua]|uniref:Uncharacterized protein n=1 Tax=Nitzschia inconspicua TaxID=303405 RepID=A0A9K3L6B8_9STRA|nr:hypothetical protein IV203_001136 [Nitzschia inconspicua]